MSVAREKTRAMTGGHCNDLIIWRHGGLCLVRPVTPEGEDWIRETAPPDTTFYQDCMIVEPRYIEEVEAHALDAGLVLG